MYLFEKITDLGRVKKIISLLTIFLFTNNITALASDKNSYIVNSLGQDNEFEKVFNQNSISYSEYDNYENQLRTFFGFNSIESEKSYFQDLSIINESDSVREIYKTKLNDMMINKNNNNIIRK